MATSNCTIEPYKHLGLTPNPDGTITRSPDRVFSAIPDHLRQNAAVLQTKDIPINPTTQTWARFYLPDPSSKSKFPLILWFRGSGFILHSVATSYLHDSTVSLALHLRAFVVSIEYRLAPEHRLPAAYDDAAAAIHWLKSCDDEWLKKFADFDRFFIGGVSAGGNIAYHAAIRIADQTVDVHPLKIRGLILHQPFFGGSKRTDSELRLANNPYLPLGCIDLMWELALPIGADRDHGYCNPTVEVDGLTKVKERGWRVIVDWGDQDPLMDRQIEFADMLERMGLDVVRYGMEGGTHGVEIIHPNNCNELYAAYVSFISS